MDDRLEEARRFVATAGWHGASIAPLSGDASFRRYFRVRDDRREAVLMDAPPDREDVTPFLRIGSALASYGYSTPAVLAEDAINGYLLLEDLGDALYARVVGQGADEVELYGAAIDVLRDLHRRETLPGVPVFDARRALNEVGLFNDWTLPALAQRAVDAAARETFAGLWRDALAPLFDGPKVLALFDYHAENLIWLPQREGLARVGLLDFQDAVAGPAALDVVSLLEDARRDVAPPLVAAMIARFLDGATADEEETFRLHYALAGAQRNTRILGVFGRLFLRDGKSAYLNLMPRVWRHLETDLAHPALAPLRIWFDEHVPQTWRRSAPEPAAFVLPRSVVP